MSVWKPAIPVVVGVLVAAVGWSVTSPAVADDSCTIPTAIAHKGGGQIYGRTEDTLGAYLESSKAGVRDWETDIRFGRHGGPVLMHDASIDRTTRGSGKVSSMNVGSSTIRMDDGQHLSHQTLHRLLALAAKKGATLSIEPKALPTASEAAKVLALIDEYGMRDRVLIDSFHTSHLAPFKAIAPDLTYALTTSKPVDPQVAAAVGPVIKINRKALTRDLVAAYHQAGVRVDESIADTPGTWAPHRNWGVDRVSTNRPTAYRGWRNWVCTHQAWPAP